MKASLALVTAFAAPFLISYVLWGTTKNGHTIMRYPHSTEVVSNKHQNYTVLIGKNDCVPSYKLTMIPFGKFVTYSRSKITPEDAAEWAEALK